MKVDLNIHNIDHFRGLKKPKKFNVYGWRRLNSEDLNYLLKSVLGPYHVEIKLRENND